MKYFVSSVRLIFITYWNEDILRADPYFVKMDSFILTVTIVKGGHTLVPAEYHLSLVKTVSSLNKVNRLKRVPKISCLK